MVMPAKSRGMLQHAGLEFVRDWFIWDEGRPLGGPALYRWGERLGVDRSLLDLWDSRRLFKIA
jgi:hypothetical protein